MRGAGLTFFTLMNTVVLTGDLAAGELAAGMLPVATRGFVVLCHVDRLVGETATAEGFTPQTDAHGQLHETLAAWRKRHEASRNVHLVCLGDDTLRYEATRWHFDTRSEFPGYNAPDRPRYQVPLNPRFDQDTKTSFERALSVSLDISPAEFSQPRGCVAILTPETCTEVFEATEATPVCEATIRMADAWLRDEGLLLRPALMHYRPLVGRVGTVDDRNWRVGADPVFVNGTMCVLLEERRSPTETDRYWVDPGRDWAVVRWIQERDAKPVVQLDVDYRVEPDTTWHPLSWTIQLFAGADVARDYPGRELIWQTGSFRVTKQERNLEPPDGSFDVSLPVGAILLEETKPGQAPLPAGFRQEIRTRAGASPGFVRYLMGTQGDRQVLSDAELRRMGLAAARGRFRGWWLAWIVPAVMAGVLPTGVVFRKTGLPGFRKVSPNASRSTGRAEQDQAG